MHILDIVHFLTGAGFPSTVTASGGRSKEKGFDAERAAILIEYPNGLLVSLTVDGSAAAQHELSVIDGAGGRIEVDTRPNARLDRSLSMDVTVAAEEVQGAAGIEGQIGLTA